MSGNVYEWCWNWATGSYDEEIEGGSDPTGASFGYYYRISRGGSCGNLFDGCTVSNRSFDFPYYRACTLGFRVVRLAN